jgi:phosphatidate cytidylyltransferase
MAQSKSSDLKPRLLSAAVLMPLLLLAVWAGGNWVAGVAAAAAAIALNELMALLRRAGWRPLHMEGVVWGAGLVGVAALDGVVVLLALAAGAVAALVSGLIRRHSAQVVGDWAFTALGVAYVGLPLAAVVLLRAGNAGFAWLAIAFLATFATDTGAFATGRLIGRHKMAPSISPGKTWEGAAGGLAAAVGATIGLVALLDDVPTEYWQAAVLGVAIGVIGQVGDLLESKLKRMAKSKDSGYLIPGHGGLLDRVDSLVLVFPVVYYASKLWPSA